MARFLVVVPHDPERCLAAIDATLNQGPGFQEAYEWGCRVGNHTGYVFVRAGGAQEAIDDYVPPFLRPTAVAHRLTQFSARDLREMLREAGEIAGR
jgi:class 3 adenylate cyclase